jgi:hypothetical protein
VALNNLLEHVRAFHTSLLRLRDPVPPRVVELFNRLLEDARSRSGRGSVGHEIPFAGKMFSKMSCCFESGS